MAYSQNTCSVHEWLCDHLGQTDSLPSQYVHAYRSFPSSLRLSLYLSLSLSFSLFHFYTCIYLKIALEEYCLKMSMRLNVVHLLMLKYFLLLLCR